jgi:nicotinamidase-related amidase
MKKIILSIVSILALCIIILAVNYYIFDKNSEIISTGEPIVLYDTVKPALLVIDVQESITGKYSDNEYYKKKSEALINTLNRVADSSVKNKIPVIYVKNEITNFLLNILNDSYAKGSPGGEFDARLKTVPDFIITKDKGDAFSNSSLDSILLKHNINKLIFTGVDLAYCVNSTIQAAANRKYTICLLSDAVLSKSDSLEKVMLDRFRESGYEVITSQEYYESLH